jgi:XTP/dITP diphosphohydrolase
LIDLLFATTNSGKLRELRRLVAGLPVRVISPADLGRPLPEVVEDGGTFLANAEKKASAYARSSGLCALADDSGLCVDVLGGAPGVHSARWSERDDGLASAACSLPAVALRELGPELSRASRDEANNDKLLSALSTAADGRRGAEYVAVLAVARPDGTIVAHVEGRCRGSIGEVRRGTNGFGYDPLFVPDDAPFDAAAQRRLTMAELSPPEKDALSHRGAAFRALRPVLAKLATTPLGGSARL